MSDSDSDSFEVMKPPERREPSRRGNAGNRMQRLLQEEEVDEEAADKDFYQQGFWADEEEDDDFAGDADDEEARDSFDSDFGDSSESESEEDEDDEKAARKKAAPKKKSVYKDPKLAHKKGAASGEAGEAGGSGAAPKPKKRPRPDPVAAGGFAAPLERSRRGATEASSAAAAERRRSTDAAAKQRAERLAAKAAKGVELRRLTQEEILAEAAQTEIINKASLERMLRMEEEKRRVTKTIRKLEGPRIRFCSRADGSGESRKLVETVSFIETPVPKNIDGIAPPYPVATRCAVSGQPAKYFDPQTNTPYATLEAFRMLRGRIGRRQSHSFGGGGASGTAMPPPLPGED